MKTKYAFSLLAQCIGFLFLHIYWRTDIWLFSLLGFGLLILGLNKMPLEWKKETKECTNDDCCTEDAKGSTGDGLRNSNSTGDGSVC